MFRPPRLEAALKRFGSALDLLEAASARLTRVGADKADLEDVLAAMEGDRGRLAAELDAALHRGQVLQQAGDAVADRLAEAGARLQRLIARDGEAG